MLEYAKDHTVEEEHAQLAVIQREDPGAFAKMLSNMALEYPDNLGRWVDGTKEVYQQLKGSESNNSGPERD